MKFTVESVPGAAHVLLVEKISDHEDMGHTLTRVEAKTLAAQLLDAARTDVDELRARARRPKPQAQREAWEIIAQLLDELEALRAKLRGEVAW